MKSIFEKTTANEIIERVNNLTPDTKPLWGIMNAAQMLLHCTVSLKLALEEITPEIIESRIEMGKRVKDKVFITDTFSKNLPTSKEFLVQDSSSFPDTKKIFLNYLNKFIDSGENSGKKGIHPYFGELSPIEWGELIWKHTNHHLTQFNV